MATGFAIKSGHVGRFAPWLGALVVCGGFGVGIASAGDAPSPQGDPAQGRELFDREWVANDHRSHGGDGLGPVFNDSSCVACHNQGGPGGAGPNSKNVDILSAFANVQPQQQIQMGAIAEVQQSRGLLGRVGRFMVAGDTEETTTTIATPGAPPVPKLDELVKLHAGFHSARSVVLHHFGTDPNYESWRMKAIGMGDFNNAQPAMLSKDQRAQNELDRVKSLMQINSNAPGMGGQTQVGDFALVRSQRNPTALFGAGLINAVPDEVIVAASKATFPDFPEVKGRVSRQKDGRIGRFGWKAQTPSLNDFVLTACAVELGLEVPGHAQGGLPQAPHYQGPGLDLTEGECASLVAYVKGLPAPVQRAMTDPQEIQVVAAGREAFATIGCASCHTPKLGDVEGIYSDLLLHDMGNDLGDTGAYGIFVPNSPEEPQPLQPLADANSDPTPEPKKDVVGALRQEWRTPPLWGFRDSGPYLHDGRANTLEQAVSLHGGQGAESARRYFALSPEKRGQVQAFLKSLVAPAPTQLARHDD